MNNQPPNAAYINAVVTFPDGVRGKVIGYTVDGRYIVQPEGRQPVTMTAEQLEALLKANK